MKQVIKSILLSIIGTFLIALAINWVSIPNALGDGGITGVTLLLHYAFNFNVSVTALILNIIILLLGLKLLNKRTILYTMVSIVSLAFFLNIVKPLPFIPENKIIAPMVTGSLVGLGLGIVIRGGGSTGGTDILALIMNKYLGLPVSTALLMCDGVVVMSLFFVIGIEKGMITIIGILIYSKVINMIVTGYNPKKALYIFSDKYDEIASEVTTRLKRGVTVLNGYGYYSKAQRHVLYIIVTNRQLIEVEKIIKKYDPHAFVAINEIQQVDGEGFTFVREQADQQPLEASI